METQRLLHRVNLGANQVFDELRLQCFGITYLFYANRHSASTSLSRAVKATQSASRVWDAKFGNFSQRDPVSICEGISGAYFCDADTPESTVQFLQYLQEHGISLEVGVWDWTSGGFGRARWDFPSPKDNSFTGLSCHQKGYGLGKWLSPGSPRAYLQQLLSRQKLLLL